MGDGPEDPAPQPELPSWARRRESVRRPVWVVVLAFAMLLFGGHLLLNGLSILGGLRAPAPVAPTGASGTSVELLRDLPAVIRALDQAHPVAVRADAASKLALALILLYAVSAVWSSDPRGRRAALVAAWAGIAYHVGEAIFMSVIMRKGLVAAAPTLVATVASTRGRTFTVEEMAAAVNLFVLLLSGVTAVLGIAFSIVVLVFFGGRKGRTFYGLAQQPPHGA